MKFRLITLLKCRKYLKRSLGTIYVMNLNATFALWSCLFVTSSIIISGAESMRKIVKAKGGDDRLKDKILATIFYEPSTRTSCSFNAAMFRLGGNVLSINEVWKITSIYVIWNIYILATIKCKKRGELGGHNPNIGLLRRRNSFTAPRDGMHTLQLIRRQILNEFEVFTNWV